MLAASHALIGAAIAAKVSNPVIGIPLSFLSHFAVDLIPHWDFGQNRREKSVRRLFIEAVFDVLLGFYLAFLVFGGSVDPLYLFIAAGVAQSPDLLESPYFIFRKELPFCVWLYNLQHKLHWRINLPWGLVTQVIFILIVLWLVNTSVIY